MTLFSIPRESVESIPAQVTAVVDPTSLPVEFAFTQGEDRPTVWTAGSWDGTATQRGTRYTATALSPVIGPGALELTPSSYPAHFQVWVQLDGASEDPVIPAGTLRIT